MKRLFILTLLVIILPVQAKATVLRISGPPIAETLPLLVMEQEGADSKGRFTIRFTPWRSPDMLRAMIAGQEVDAAIMTTAMASTLYNRGVFCRVIMLYESPIWIVSATPGPDDPNSLQGTLLFPFGPADMPTLLYQATATDSSRAPKLRNTGGALEALNLLLAGKGDNAMLSEPTASIAVQRSKDLESSTVRRLYKRVDMRRAWSRRFPGHRLTTGSVVLFGSKAEEAHTATIFTTAYEQACRWVGKHPEKALELARKRFPTLAAQLEITGLDHFQVHSLSGKDAATDALFFLQQIGDLAPASIGGSTPKTEFFEMMP